MDTEQNMNTLKWNNIPWALIDKYILQIQNRIYYAEKKNDKKHVYVLQNKLSKSWSLQTKNFFELFFIKKNIKQLSLGGNVNEHREFLQNMYPFFYNNENIKNKIFSIFSLKNTAFSSFFFSKEKKIEKEKIKEPFISKRKKSNLFNHKVVKGKKNKKSLLKEAKTNKKKKYRSFDLNPNSTKKQSFLYRREVTPLQTPMKLITNLINSKDQNSLIFNKNFFIMKLIEEKQNFQNKQNIGKLYFTDEPCKNYEIISPWVISANMKSLNCRSGIDHFFYYLFLIEKISKSRIFFSLEKKTKGLHVFSKKKQRYLGYFFSLKRKKKDEIKNKINEEPIKKFFNSFIDYKTSMIYRNDALLFAPKIIFKYYQFQFLQDIFIFSINPMNSNISLKNLTFKNSVFFIISKKNIYNKKNKKDEIRFYKFNKLNQGWFSEFDIFFKKKIDFYRKSKNLEKKLKCLLQIFYLTKDTDYQVLKNNKQFMFSSFFQFTYLNEKMSFLEIKKIIKLAQKKKKIEPQWQARYECSSYSLKKGSSSFNKIQAIYKTICDEPKYILKIEIKSLWQALLIEQLNNKKSYFFFLKKKNDQFENFIYLLKNFFFYGLEKAFFHILKKQYFNLCNSFLKQILIFDKNQIIILHKNDIFLKKFCQFFFSSSFRVDRTLEKKNFSSLPLSWNVYRDNSLVDLNSIKTQIVHSFMPYEKNPPGIDFLGFHINQLNKKQYLQKNIDLDCFKKPVPNITKFNIQTFIAPSLSNVRNHLLQIRTIIKQSKTSTQELLIKRLSPKIRGWSKFYSQAFSLLDKKREYQKTSKYCDYLTFKMLWRWACRRHPNKNRKWIKLKYFKTLNNKNWVFCVYKKIEPVEKNSLNNSALIPLEKNSFVYATSTYLCLPLHRET